MVRGEYFFSFISDARTSGRGFWIEVRRKKGTCRGDPPRRGCNQRLTKALITISSPKYPAPYPPNLDCEYQIERSSPDVCALRVELEHFDLESVSGCFYDHFQLTPNDRLCGRLPPGTERILPFASHEPFKQLRFHSDGQVGRTGFRVKIHQETYCELPPPPSCAVCTSEHHGILTSYGYPDAYRNRLRCSYTIEKAGETYCGVQLDFDEFSVSPSAGCASDYLQIGRRRYCGTTLHSSRKVLAFQPLASGDSQSMDNRESGSIRLLFVSDHDGTAKGFSARYKQIPCSLFGSGHFRPDEGQDGHPVPDSDFELDGEKLPKPKPAAEDDDEQHQQQQQPHQIEQQRRLQPEEHGNPLANGPEKRLHKPLTLNSLGGGSQRSEEGEREQKPHNERKLSCDQEFSERNFLFRSPVGTDNGYPNDLRCSYRIKRNSSRVCYVELSFLRFDVEASPQCQFDYLEVNNVRLCGTLQRPTTRTYIFTGQEKWIRFHSDSSTSRAGFLIRGEQLECNGDAIIRPPLNPGATSGQNIDGETKNGVFPETKPSYESNFPTADRKTTSIDITSHSGHSQIKVAEPVKPIQLDSNLPIHSLHYLDPNLIQQVNQPTPPTQQFVQYQQQQYTSLDSLPTDPPSDVCHEQLFTEMTFQLRSPGFPSPIGAGSACEYTVRKQRSEVCQLEMHVMEFHMGPAQATNCPMDDHLNFNGQPLCGQLPAKAVKFFPFVNNEFHIRLRTPNQQPAKETGGERSYLLQLRQRECPSVVKPTFINGGGFGSGEHVTLGSLDKGLTGSGMGNTMSIANFGSTKGGLSISKLPPKPALWPSKSHLPDKNLDDKFNQRTPGGLSTTNCDQHFEQTSFEIHLNTRITAANSRAMRCTFSVQKAHSNVCALQLKLLQLQIASLSVVGCAGDFLLLDGQRFCAEVQYPLVRQLPFNGASTSIALHLGEPGEKRLHARLQQIDCSSGPIKVISNFEGSVKRPPSSSVIESNAPASDPMPPKYSVNLSIDPIKVKQPTTNPETKLDKQIIPTFSPTENLTNDATPMNNTETNERDRPFQSPRFPTQSATGSRAPSICELCYTELSGEITSYAFPDPYPDNINCNYKITGQPNFCGVYIRFDVFNLPSEHSSDTRDQSEGTNNALRCESNYVELNGARYCGDQLLNIKSKSIRPFLITYEILLFHFSLLFVPTNKPEIIAFEQSPKELSFRFVSQKHLPGSGFRANYMQIPCYLTPGQQAILSAMMQDSSISTNASAASRPQMATDESIKDKHLEHIQQEAMNYYNFYTVLAQPLGSSDNSKRPETVDLALSGSSSSISGHSRFASTARIPCDRVILQRTFELISPAYPYAYPPGSDCLYSIRRASGVCRLKLQFLEFQLQTEGGYQLIKDNHQAISTGLTPDGDGDCNAGTDYLQMDEKKKFCGSQLNGTESKFEMISKCNSGYQF